MSKFSPEAFRKACGDSSSLGILAEEPKGPGTRFTFDEQPFAVVGRNKVSDVILNDQRVSRRHAYLQILNGSVYCVDLKGSRFAGWLSPMQAVRMGGCTLRLVAESPAASPCQGFDPLAAGGVQKPFVTLEFLNSRKSQAEWSVDRPLTLIGTSSWCKLRVHSPNVAPVHASLVCTDEGAWLVDLLSLTGILVNGRRVRLAQLEDNDELRIGNFAMRVHCRQATSLVSQSNSAALQPEPARNGITRRSHLTTVDFGPTAPEMTLEPTRQKTQALEGVADSSVKAMVESVFFPMLQQFSAMQDQMFDQVQQTMALMFQMFGTLQKEQIDVLRGELDRVHSLTREIQALQLKLKEPTSGVPGSAGREIPPGKESRSPHDVATPVSVADRQSANTNQGGRNPTPLERLIAGNTETNGLEVHSLLCERMAELQEDRRGRIKKMVDFLSGK